MTKIIYNDFYNDFYNASNGCFPNIFDLDYYDSDNRSLLKEKSPRYAESNGEKTSPKLIYVTPRNIICIL